MLTAQNAESLSRDRFDLIVVGGGVYGIMATLEAVRRGLRPLLLERGDFGAATSHNSLRVIHGGLRYLQNLDVHRVRESVAERRWFLRMFPDLVAPLPCLAPLYGDGLHRAPIYRAALAINDLLSPARNRDVAPQSRLPRGRMLSARETEAAFPDVSRKGLESGALWYDAYMPDAPRLLLEVLHWACGAGASVLNYVEARSLVREGDRIAGVRAIEFATGREFAFRAEVVINAAGPWAPGFAADCGAERSGLYEPCLAWNVVLRRRPLSDHALAVRPRRPGGQVYFLIPWKGATLAGTGHAPWFGGPDEPAPSDELMRRFLDDLDQAAPALALDEDAVAAVWSGLLPAIRPGTADLAVREVIRDHAAHGGPKGLFSVGGVKFTTARRVADKVLARAFRTIRPRPYGRFQRPTNSPAPPDYPFSWMPAPDDPSWLGPLRRAVTDEAVHHLDDLLLRRSSLGDNPARARALAPRACTLFDWDSERAQREIARLGADPDNEPINSSIQHTNRKREGAEAVRISAKDETPPGRSEPKSISSQT